MDAQRILCPVDFSQPSRVALEHAVALAKLFDGALTIFHVYQVPAYTLPDGVVLPTADQLKDLFERVDTALAEWKQIALELGAGRVDTAAAQGVVWNEIVNRAQEGGYDLIVVGTHGYTGLRHVLLGSVAERVVQRASCPVLTVRSTGK